jgi:hypothetical protein
MLARRETALTRNRESVLSRFTNAVPTNPLAPVTRMLERLAAFSGTTRQRFDYLPDRCGGRK